MGGRDQNLTVACDANRLPFSCGMASPPHPVHIIGNHRLERFVLRLLLLRFGTLAPDLRACESPMAMACFRLLTDLPERPLFSLPRLRSCIAFFTFSPAFLL